MHLRVKNLLNEIWGENIDDDMKAKILKEKDPEVALILAMRYLEHQLWKRADQRLNKNEMDTLKASAKKGNILLNLMDAADIDPLLMTKAQRIWRKRNLAMHIGDDSGANTITITDVDAAIELNRMIN